MWNSLKEDIKIFKLVRDSSLGSYFYYPEIRIIIIFRLSQWFYMIRLLRPVAYFLTNLNDFLHGVWIGPRVKMGKGLSLAHPRGLVVNPTAKVGDYCSILQRVTIGGPNIVIGNNVEILAGAQIISNKRGKGSITIGDGAVIGAGALVIDDVERNAIVGGIPAKVIGYREVDDNWVNYLKQDRGHRDAA